MEKEAKLVAIIGKHLGDGWVDVLEDVRDADRARIRRETWEEAARDACRQHCPRECQHKDCALARWLELRFTRRAEEEGRG